MEMLHHRSITMTSYYDLSTYHDLPDGSLCLSIVLLNLHSGVHLSRIDLRITLEYHIKCIHTDPPINPLGRKPINLLA